MKTGVCHITFTDGMVHMLCRSGRRTTPLIQSFSAPSVREGVAMARAFAEDRGFPLEHAVVALDGRDCLLRSYAVPVRSRSHALKAALFELEDDLPLDRDALVTDAFRGGRFDGVSHVCVAAVQKERLRSVLEEFEKAGVIVDRLDADVAAFARACLALEPGSASCACLDMGRERLLFSLLSDGGVRSMAVVPWGTERLVRACAEATGLSAGEVDRALLLENGTHDLTPHMERFLETVLREVARLSGDAEWPARFVVSGGIVQAAAFRRTFESLSGGMLDVWEESRLEPGGEVDTGVRGSGLAVAYGLAEPGEAGFEFRRGEFAVVDAGKTWRRELRYCMVLAALLLAGWAVYVHGRRVAAENELALYREATVDLYRAALPDVGRKLAPVQYRSILDARSRELAGMGVGSGAAMPVIETLRLVSESLDAGIEVEFLGLAMDSGSLSVQGVCRSMNGVDAVRASLEGTEAFRDVVVRNAVADGSGGVRFDIEVAR